MAIEKVVRVLLVAAGMLPLAVACGPRYEHQEMAPELGLARLDSLLMRGGGAEAVLAKDSATAVLWTRLFGYEETEGYARFLGSFAADSGMQALQDSIFAHFPNTNQTNAQLCHAFGALRTLWPEVRIPRIAYTNGGFNASFMIVDGILGICLDRFLGAACPYYSLLGIPRYVQRGLAPERIATDALKGWVEATYPLPASRQSVLDNMIYYGKLLLLAQECLPQLPDSLNLSYGEEELAWLEQHESDMWQLLAERELLYERTPLTISQLTMPAPFTKQFGEHSPGRAAVWLGYRIVASYKKRTGATWAALMAEQDGRAILRNSGYHPER